MVSKWLRRITRFRFGRRKRRTMDGMAENIQVNTVSESISTTTTTKTVKKKKSTENGDVTAKTKKTKKTKKSEEKENHISVITNGHHENGFDALSTDSQENPEVLISSGPVDDDELSNICVRDLKQLYCREAAKSSSVSLKVPSEEPVPAAVPIKELRRSFCDLQKACESQPVTVATLSPSRALTPSPRTNGYTNQLKARSLGDLRRLTDSPQHRSINTGVSVKALAASYWNLVSNEPTTPPIVLTPPPNRNVAHTLKKSSFSKFDQLQKKSVLHVRSSDASKIQKQLNQDTPEVQGANPTCKACNKTVFAMEQIKAERSVWHKNCFRCKECSKQLTVDIYQSHEGELYCKPHFKELFKPKAVLDNADEEPLRRRKPEMIIRENQPVELPPDVVRASDKADLGLEELSALNVKSRFQVFEKTSESIEVERSPSTVNVKRSPSILSKLAKFQKKGMDIGVPDETLNGVDYEESSSSEDEAQEDGQVVKGSKLTEKPISFNKMEDVKRTWESSSGSQKTKEELRAEHKKEISQIRSRLFQGKQGKMKEMYEQAVAESEGKITTKKDPDIVASEKARLLKERFERGEVIHSDSEEDEEKKSKNKDVEDMSVFEAGISKKSRSIFLELDATAAKTQTSPISPPVHALTPRVTERRTSQTVSRQVSEDIVRASDSAEDVVVPTADISNKFKFFETYKPPEKERKSFRITPPRDGQVKVKPAKTPFHRCVLCLANNGYASDLSQEETPDREVYRDPSVVRSEDTTEDETIVKRSQTASRMLSLFRQMEEQKEALPDGPKPLKCFTPPPDYKEDQSGSASSEEEEEESEEEAESGDDGIVRSSDKIEDEFLKQAQNAARAKALKDKFEHWEPEKQSVNNAINMLESEQESIESTKSLRARFESLKAEVDQPKEKPRPKVNRFVVQETPAINKSCVSCVKTVYPLEEISVNGRVYHANCFRCQQCHCKLRMETYTLNNDTLYCLTHFKQLFISKGNYDEGFGSSQHKSKWESQTALKEPEPKSPVVNGH
ncbi:uncharacterized protein LOC128993818 isoform X12 [Macrosteles quadrilineatus]|uniref:uncharacterized protein LOC128993818 isoform X12 n=2 Tax=Macrosteles quadrilineatus TaxID=74068 RepID=UPI0023E16E4F|nr:uncharacterized protein LOC128993818 isoform X12 [Macrosteles quadrilineatus]